VVSVVVNNVNALSIFNEHIDVSIDSIAVQAAGASFIVRQQVFVYADELY